MKRFFLNLLAKWKFLVLPALLKMGFWGVGLIAIVDTSSIPVPMDALIALYAWSEKGHFWIYCVTAAAGSAIGGLVPYWLGRAGGEIFLLKRVDRDKFEKMRVRFENQEFLAILIPSMLPPPTPWKAFVFAAGVFEMRVVVFMLAVFLGRMIRWVLLGLLVMKLGPGALEVVGHAVHDHLGLFLTGLVLVFVAIGAWAFMRKRNRDEVAD